MKQARFAVTYPPERAHPVHRAIMDGTGISRMALLMWGPRTTITTLSWFDGPECEVSTVLAAAGSATDSELVPGDDGTYAFLRQTEYELDESILTLVSDAGVVFLPPIVFRESGTVTVEAVGTASLLSEFHDDLGDLIDTRIERVRPFHRGAGTSTVTDRQREAVAAAIGVGYYEIPRTGSVADVAREIDCSTSTAGELLRKAEAALARSFAEPDRAVGAGD